MRSASTSLYNVPNGRTGMECRPAIENSLMTDQSKHGNHKGYGVGTWVIVSRYIHFPFVLNAALKKDLCGGVGWMGGVKDSFDQ